MSDASKVQLEKLKIFQEPQCLIDTVDGHLVVVEETKDDLMKITLPLNVVAIAGLYRTGKSYLMNRLAGQTSGFALGNSIQSKTKGIWAWCKIHPTEESQVLLLLDTEGLGDIEKGNPDHDNKIFILATLLSSTLVYNIMTAFNQDAVEKLTFIVKMSENLRVSDEDSTDNNFDMLMPEFVLCIRDFSLLLEIDGKMCDEDEYLEHCLKAKEIKDKNDEKYNRPRECIRKYFTKRKAFTFDRPASRKAMLTLDQARNENLSPEFVEETVKFISYIYGRPGKILQNKKPVTGRMLAEILVVYITAIKDGKVPCVQDAITVMSKAENKKRAQAAIEKFRNELDRIKLPIPAKADLLRICKENQTNFLKELNSELVFDDDNAIEKSAKAEMEKLRQQIEEENSKQLYSKCFKLLSTIHDEEIQVKVNSKKYMVAGGYEMYKTDMTGIIEKYTNALAKENVDPDQIEKAKYDFLTDHVTECEAIMEADKNISDKEKTEEMQKREKEMKQQYDETQERERARYNAELQRQNKRHEDEMEIIRKTQAEKEKADTAAYFNEKLAQRDQHILQLNKDVSRLEGRMEAKAGGGCTIS